MVDGFHAHVPAIPARADVLQEREQIRALLLQVRRWVEHHEPSSPVTILLKQADRMWGKRFSEVAHMIPSDLMRVWDQED
jgi:type VI secretion system protein ImpA